MILQVRANGVPIAVGCGTKDDQLPSHRLNSRAHEVDCTTAVAKTTWAVVSLRVADILRATATQYRIR